MKFINSYGIFSKISYFGAHF